MKETFYTKYGKRALDILCSGAALVVLGIPMAVVAVAIKKDLGSPVVFKQERIGLNEKKFIMLKFRSMKTAFDENGVPLPDEQRITKLGRFIRKTSIDELPSLISIFKGEMSVIGPRPLPWNYKPWFKKDERIRHSVRGGLSGLAQVNGRTSLSWEEKFAYDKQYVENITFLGDVKLVFQTVSKAFIKQENVVERSDAVAKDFHCYRSGLTEAELIKLEKEGGLPENYEEWIKCRNS